MERGDRCQRVLFTNQKNALTPVSALQNQSIESPKGVDAAKRGSRIIIIRNDPHSHAERDGDLLDSEIPAPEFTSDQFLISGLQEPAHGHQRTSDDVEEGTDSR